MDLLKSAAASGSDDAKLFLLRQYADAQSAYYNREEANALVGQIKDQLAAQKILDDIERP